MIMKLSSPVLLLLLLSSLLILNCCSEENLKNILSVVNHVRRTLEHSCQQEIYNLRLVGDLRVEVERLQAEVKETKEDLERTRDTTQRNFYGVLELTEQIKDVKGEKGEVGEKLNVEKFEGLEKQIGDLKAELQLIKDEKEKTEREFRKEFDVLKEERNDMKQEIEELKRKMRSSDRRTSANDGAILLLSSRLTDAEETAIKVDTNTDKISNIRNEITGFKKLEPAQDVHEFVWKLQDYKNNKKLYGDEYIFSEPFFVGRGNYGYTMRAGATLNGWFGGRHTHIFIVYQFMESKLNDILPWPFLASLEITILSQNKSKDDLTWTGVVDKELADQHPTAYLKPGTGLHDYLPNSNPIGISEIFLLSTVEAPPYLVNDTMYIKITFTDVKSLN